MGVHVLELSVSDEEWAGLEARARAAGLPNPIAYLKDFVRRGPAAPAIPDAPVSADMTFAEILAPVHAQAAASGITEEELDELIEEARNEVYQGKMRREARSK